MPLVPAKCTACGAVLTIDSTKEAVVCQYCGNAFVVEKAINHYNTYNSVVNNITSDNVVVHLESEKERLNTSAETYIKLGNAQKALNIYRELVDRFPDDWRGWWGSIYYYYDYRNIQKLYEAGKQAELEQQMALFKKIAPLEEYEKLDKVIKTRVDEVKAALKAAYAKRIEELSTKLSEARSNHNKAQSELKQAIKAREIIEANEERLKKRQENIGSIPTLGVLAVIVFGVLGLIDGAGFFPVLVVCGLLAVGVYFVLSLLCMILTAVLIKYPVGEWNNASQKERGIRCTVEDLENFIASAEKELNQYERRYEYLEFNKDTRALQN